MRATNNKSVLQTWESLSLTWAFVSVQPKGLGGLESRGSALRCFCVAFLDFSQDPICTENPDQCRCLGWTGRREGAKGESVFRE